MHESAWRTERIDRNICQSVAEFAFVTAASMDGLVYGGPKWTVSAIYEGMLKEEMDSAASRHPDVAYHPMLIDAAYAGLMTEQWDRRVVIPSLNRDGDCLSDLVLAMFGSIAGAESVLLALDERTSPNGRYGRSTARDRPVTRGKERGQSHGHVAGVRRGPGTRRYPGGRPERRRLARDCAAPRSSTAMDGIRCFDLGGSASTSEVVDEVVSRMRATERIVCRTREPAKAPVAGLRLMRREGDDAT